MTIEQVEEIMATVDDKAAPRNMDLEEALEFYEELTSQLESRIDAVRYDIDHQETNEND